MMLDNIFYPPRDHSYFFFFHSAGRYGRHTDSDAARIHRASRVIRNHVFIQSYSHLVQCGFRFFSGYAEASEHIHQNHVIIRPAEHQFESVFFKFDFQNFGVFEYLSSIFLKRRF